MDEILANAQGAHYYPQFTKILEYCSCTYACDKCENNTSLAHIITAKALPSLMKNSLASLSILANIMTKKYVNGVPLARLEKFWTRECVGLSRATLVNWVIQCIHS